MRFLRFAAVAAITACARSTTVSEAPAPARPAATTPAPTPRAARPTEPQRDWQLLDADADRVPGISVRRAERELLAGKEPKRTVVVAIIDGGIDTAHVSLKANLWTNPRETPGNGKDDDGNGYVDDIHGWNFIGGRDGRDVHHDLLEVTRLYARCSRPPNAGSPAPAKPDSATCARATADFEKQRTDNRQTGQQIEQIAVALDRTTEVLRRALGIDSLTRAKVTAFQPTGSETQQAKALWLRIQDAGITPARIAEAKADVESKAKYGLNPDYDPRTIVGDDPTNVLERGYGNFDVMGPDARHGTHVSGIIGGVRGTGTDGVAAGVKIMMIRTVPDGDERDKDVANAIRYAVDNGASVINMSFGKGFSPEKAAVDAAVKYADSKGVLMVHAAGNDAEDLAEAPNFPTPVYLGSGGKAANWIEVGASSWKGADSLAASFSNYGKAQVDVFAPGVDILSTVPGGTYERDSGTSMAAPVVTGLAALIMSYYPNLSAADVKRIILDSATRYANQRVVRPGAPNGEQVTFGSLSSTGGVVNAYAALKLAAQLSTTKP